MRFGWNDRKKREAEEARRRAQRATSPDPLLDPLNVASPLSPLNPIHHYDSTPSPSYSSHDSGGSSDSGGGGSSGGGGGSD